MVDYYLFDGKETKSINPGDLPLDDYIRLSSENNGGVKLWDSEPFLSRAVDVVAQAVSSLPRDVVRGSDVVEGELPGLEDLDTLLYQIAKSVLVYGYAYLYKTSNRVIAARWVSPKTIKPQYSQVEGLTSFKRTIGGSSTTWSVEDVVYIWQPAIDLEVGPGPAPIAAAMKSAGVLASTTEYTTTFFERGAIFPMLLTVDGNPSQSELDRLQNWWRRFVRGLSSAWESIAVRANVKPEIIGPPVSDMAMPELTDIQQRNILAALGVPYSLVMSDAANYATANQDYINLYDLAVIPLVNRIFNTLNRQWLGRFGVELVAQPKRLEVYQAQNLESGQSLVPLVGAGILTIDEAREILGYEPGEVQPPPELPPPDLEPVKNVLPAGALYTTGPMREDDLNKFRRKALKMRGPVPFQSDAIGGEAAIIIAALGHCRGLVAIDHLFDEYQAGGVKAILGASDNTPEYQLAMESAFVPEVEQYLQAEAEYYGRYYVDNGELPPREDRRSALAAFLLPFLIQWGEDEFARQQQLLGELALPVVADVVADIRGWAKEYSVELAGILDDTTRAIAKQVAASYDGATFNQQDLIADLARVIGPRWRAEMIAQTEVTRALNAVVAFIAGAVYLITETNIIYTTAKDERVCPVCGPRHGEKRKPGQSYPGGPPPPLHPRCRCREVIEVVEA